MDFAGFCDEAVRAFLLRGRDALFFCLAICCRRAVEVWVARRPGRFPGGTYHAVGMNFGKVRELVMTVMELDALKDVDVRTVEKEGLVDIREVEIDRSLPLEERKRAYLEAVGNPYAVRVGDMKVRVRFMEGGGSFEEAFENMLRNV